MLFTKSLKVFLVVYFLCHWSLSTLAQDRLLYVLTKSGHQIHTFNLSDPATTAETLGKSVASLSNPYAFLHDPISDELHWVDAKGKMLVSGGAEDTTSTIQMLNELQGPTDLALDANARQLYILDHLGAKIFRRPIDGGTNQLLVSDSLKRPTSIALSAQLGRIFWTDMDLKKIFSCALDGSDIQVFFQPEQGYAVQLSISDQRGELYWSDDVQKTISAIGLDGTGERVLYQGGADEAPYGLFIDESADDLYWSDYKQGTVWRLGLDNLQTVQLVDGLSEPLDVLIIDRMPGSQLRQNMDQAGTQATSFNVFPNPTKNHLMVSVSGKIEPGAVFSIYDRQGRLLRKVSLQSQNFQLDISTLSAGWYLCSLQSERVRLQKSFVVLP
ncbi:MAG: T9SS type A sorting domain-containing protein [Bacteroidota bacterium]